MIKIKDKVYYAHSKRIYDTPREAKELRYLNKKFSNNIVDPNKDIGELGNMEPYLKKVRECDIVICSEFMKHIGKGVYEEVADGLRKNKKVFVLRKGIFGFCLKKVKELKIIDSIDWKIYYGKLCS